MSSPTSLLTAQKLIRLEATDNPEIGIYNGREVNIPTLKKQIKCVEIQIDNGNGKLSTIFLQIREKNISEK